MKELECESAQTTTKCTTTASQGSEKQAAPLVTDTKRKQKQVKRKRKAPSEVHLHVHLQCISVLGQVPFGVVYVRVHSVYCTFHTGPPPKKKKAAEKSFVIEIGSPAKPDLPQQVC